MNQHQITLLATIAFFSGAYCTALVVWVYSMWNEVNS